jgi:hypothetical protein
MPWFIQIVTYSINCAVLLHSKLINCLYVSVPLHKLTATSHAQTSANERTASKSGMNFQSNLNNSHENNFKTPVKSLKYAATFWGKIIESLECKCDFQDALNEVKSLSPNARRIKMIHMKVNCTKCHVETPQNVLIGQSRRVIGLTMRKKLKGQTLPRLPSLRISSTSNITDKNTSSINEKLTGLNNNISNKQNSVPVSANVK